MRRAERAAQEEGLVRYFYLFMYSTADVDRRRRCSTSTSWDAVKGKQQGRNVGMQGPRASEAVGGPARVKHFFFFFFFFLNDIC